MQNLVNFEDLHFLFGLNTHNRGLIRMDLDEASYLYKLVKSLKNPRCIEIGTYLGGSAILMASAGGNVITVDNYSSKTFENTSRPFETLKIKNILNKYNLKIKFMIGNSHICNNSGMKCDLLLIDGHHSYESVKKDYEHWKHTVEYNGHILFHDSCRARENATYNLGVIKFLKEWGLKPIHQVGSLSHFKL